MKKFNVKEIINIIKEYQKDTLMPKLLKLRDNKAPEMAIISVDPTDASKSYMRSKVKYFEDVLGITPNQINIDVNDNTDEYDLTVDMHYRLRSVCTGSAIVQLPLPKKFETVQDTIPRALSSQTPTNHRDVDGMSYGSVYKTYGLSVKNEDLLSTMAILKYPCTPRGIMCIIKSWATPNPEIVDIVNHSNDIDLNGFMPKGLKVTIIGRGLLVGKPLATMLINAGATVTVCNSKTSPEDIAYYCNASDVIVLATGALQSFDKSICSDTKRQLVVDCGIGHKDGKLVGDFVHDDNDLPNVEYTPVPGGVGPMTVCMLAQNYLENEIQKVPLRDWRD